MTPPRSRRTRTPHQPGHPLPHDNRLLTPPLPQHYHQNNDRTGAVPQGRHAKKLRPNTATQFCHASEPNTGQRRQENLRASTTKCAKPSSTSIPRRPPPMQLIRQLWPSYDHATNATPPRYESPFLSYEPSCTPLSAMQPPPPNFRAHPSRRNPPTPCLAPTPAIQHQFYTCVSYGPATTTLQIRHLPDTNHLASDTKSVEMSNVLLSGPTTPTRPTFPPTTTTKSANSVPSAQTAPVRLIRQLRPRYRHATNATPFRYEENRSSYEERRTPLSGLRPSPTQDFPPCHDEIRQPRPNPEISPLWNSLVQYEPATAVERMERCSDTNHSFTATNRVPLPICHGTVPHPNARPILSVIGTFLDTPLGQTYYIAEPVSDS